MGNWDDSVCEPGLVHNTNAIRAQDLDIGTEQQEGIRQVTPECGEKVIEVPDNASQRDRGSWR